MPDNQRGAEREGKHSLTKTKKSHKHPLLYPQKKYTPICTKYHLPVVGYLWKTEVTENSFHVFDMSEEPWANLVPYLVFFFTFPLHLQLGKVPGRLLHWRISVDWIVASHCFKWDFFSLKDTSQDKQSWEMQMLDFTVWDITWLSCHMSLRLDSVFC